MSIEQIKQDNIKAQFNREIQNSNTFKDVFLIIEKYYEIEKTELGILRSVIISGLTKGIELYNVPMKTNIGL